MTAMTPDTVSHIVAEYLLTIGPTDGEAGDAGSAFMQLLHPEIDELEELYGRELDYIYPGMESELAAEFGVGAATAVLTLPAGPALETIVALFIDVKAALRERIDVAKVPAQPDARSRLAVRMALR